MAAFTRSQRTLLSCETAWLYSSVQNRYDQHGREFLRRKSPVQKGVKGARLQFDGNKWMAPFASAVDMQRKKEAPPRVSSSELSVEAIYFEIRKATVPPSPVTGI